MKQAYKLCKVYDAKGDLSKRWFVYFYLLDPISGQYHRKKEYAPTYLNGPERYAHLNAMKEALDKMLIRGEIGRIEKPQFEAAQPSQLIPSLLTVLDLKYTYITDRTKNSYDSIFRFLDAWLKVNGIHGIYAKDFTRGMAHNFIHHYQTQRKWKGKTFNGYLGLIRTLFESLVDNETIETNPFAKIKNLPERDPNIRIWTDDEQRIFSEYARQHEPNLYLAVSMIYKTSFRPKEICALRFSDVKHDAGVIIVPGDIAKGRRGKPVTMSRSLSEMILKHQGQAPEHYYLFSPGLKPGTKGTHRNAFSARFKVVREKLGLPFDLKMYSFKHKGNIDDHLKHGVSLMQLKERNRHFSLAETDKYMRRNISRADPQLRDLNNDL